MARRFGDPTSRVDVNVWLFIVDPGHLRVFSEQEAKAIADLDELPKTDVAALETQHERERLVALRLRLLQTAIVWERRLKIPSEAFDLCGEYLDRSHVWLEHSSSHLDVYTATYVQRALAIRPSEFLPSTFHAE
jgi:hypothetical protein